MSDPGCDEWSASDVVLVSEASSISDCGLQSHQLIIRILQTPINTSVLTVLSLITFSSNSALFAVTLHSVSVPPFTGSVAILHSLLSGLGLSIKLSVQTPRESRGIWFTGRRPLVCPLLQKNALRGLSELLNRRREDAAGCEVDWFSLEEGGQFTTTDHILMQCRVIPGRELHAHRQTSLNKL